ncbi:hypothetical protein IGB42_03270 [Andreprevotia sp. IGB-42]|uniref:MCP four helix bundle domain-containing protein n=1 Tax=Andreprevotia sp. IGB-42 TaxID=2497473 RepID=UPI0013599C59|nr:MCP four helix bundle domain-containing protein [Andreprevotia sp. IGB-42]KAF0812280.1 hypothetical protein IGB42_03270 [Andreprevotia sp. IGB-42]
MNPGFAMAILRLTMGQRLGLGFAAVIALLAVITGYSWHQMGELEDQLRNVVVENNRQLETVHRLKEAILAEEGYLLRLLLADQPAKAQALARQVDAAHRSIAQLGQQLGGVETAQAKAQLLQALAGYNAEVMQIRDMLDIQDRYGATTEVNIELRQQRAGVFTVLDHMLAERTAMAAHAVQQSTASVAAARYWLILLGAATALIALLTAWRSTRAVVRDIGLDLDAAVSLAADLAAGRLRLAMRRNAFPAGSMMDSLLAMRDRMMDDWRYRKTVAGAAAISGRDKLVDGRTRQLLVLVDGQRPLSTLIEVFGETAWPQLRELEALGFIERAEFAAVPLPPEPARPHEPVHEAAGLVAEAV